MLILSLKERPLLPRNSENRVKKEVTSLPLKNKKVGSLPSEYIPLNSEQFIELNSLTVMARNAVLTTKLIVKTYL